MKPIGIIGLILNIVGAINAFIGFIFNAQGYIVDGITPLGSIGFAVVLIGIGSICLSFGQKH